MELQINIPTSEGQICKMLNPMADENPADVYIVAENPEYFDADENIYVVSLTELQRNIQQPALTPQIAVAKKELIVISESLEQYIATWNK